METVFAQKYKALNTEQKSAVDALDGPVMVIAGPGTGKTEVLAVRIANILDKTDTPAYQILCLTFTRSGVSAMKKRLERYIGDVARQVEVNTFHSFAQNLVQKQYELLDFETPPELLDEKGAILLCDEILHRETWEYLRPRGNSATYFRDIKSLISLLKRERLAPQTFLEMVEEEITTVQNDPISISSRGESKGSLKKEIVTKIESLSRTKEVVKFYTIYEKEKRDRALMDYDDVLMYAVQLVENFDDVRADIYEQYLYVLVDEHQDSSGVQNAFLRGVWGEQEKPNIFVVGDDRQLIYGFGGASLEYFEDFKTAFGRAQLITLVQNYRSTAPILSLADTLLASALTKEKLQSNCKGDDVIGLYEYQYPRDEIIAAGLYFKKLLGQGVAPEELAILVPKNHHVRSAIATLRNMDLPVSIGGALSLFATREYECMMRVLGILQNPYDAKLIAESLFDYTAGIPPIAVHQFLHNTNTRTLSLDTLLQTGGDMNLFDTANLIYEWGQKLVSWVAASQTLSVEQLVQKIGMELFVDTATDHTALVRAVEVVRTLVHLAQNKNTAKKVADFISYIQRLESYGENIPLATLESESGITVQTLHASKGLEYDHVWIAHMNESVLMGQKAGGFTLPEKIKQHVEVRDREVARRELYVAITRARSYCTISYAAMTYTGTPLALAEILQDIPKVHFAQKTAQETQTELLASGPTVYIQNATEAHTDAVAEIVHIVQNQYTKTRVSVTLLNNFFSCPWKWYFRNLLQMPESKNDSLVFGSLVHSCIEWILKNKKIPIKKELEEKIDALFLKQDIAENSTSKKMKKECIAAVMGWVQTYFEALQNMYESEQSISCRLPEFGDMQFYGKIDLLETYPDGSYRVTDFKTGSSKTASSIEKISDKGRLSDYMRQLAMYSFLIIHSGRSGAVAESRLLFLEAEKSDKHALYSTHIEPDIIEKLIADIREYTASLLAGEWIYRPCEEKNYGGGHAECEYCKRAKNLFNISTK
jgi:DNA helicase-2/ATP-dependent DNA helicase PcrA